MCKKRRKFQCKFQDAVIMHRETLNTITNRHTMLLIDKKKLNENVEKLMNSVLCLNIPQITCTRDKDITYIVHFISQELQCMNLNVLGTQQGCVHNRREHFQHMP